MDHFKLHSEYKPTGDQPQAIEKLVEGFKEGFTGCHRLRQDLHYGERYRPA